MKNSGNFCKEKKIGCRYSMKPTKVKTDIYNPNSLIKVITCQVECFDKKCPCE